MFRHLRRRHIAFAAGAFLLLVCVVFGCWLAVRAVQAKSNLEAARSSAQQAKDALLEGDTEGAAKFADEALSHAEDARDATHSIPWSIASAVPWLGDPFTTGQEISDVVLGLAADVLQPAADVGAVLSPDQLLQGSRVDVQALREREPDLTALAAAATELDENAKAISDPGYVSLLRDARSQLQEQTSNVAGLLDNTALAARLAPSMMGADGARTYFMAFQTNAEARGTGGLLGGFGILRFDNGTATVDTLASNRDLDGASASVDLGREFADMYGFTNPMTDFRNSNLSSHFPYAAQIWKSMWAEQTGMNVDGVILLDPVTLSYVLGAVGPVRMPDGEVITKDNVVELTESTAYSRFPTDQTARKTYLQDIANEVVRKITGRIESPQKLLDALGKAVGERRIAVWGSVPAEQELLEETPLAHVVPDDPAPYAEVVINNLGGNKLDYYLRRQIEYVADGCNADTRMSTVTIRLANEAPKTGLPDYVATAPGIRPDVPLDVPKGAMVTSVRLLATTGATLVSALVDGQQVPVFSGTERGHPTFEVQLGIPPGQSGELSFRLSEPTSAGPARVPVQPLIDTVDPKISVPACSG
ncbi:DUF4012 domain-containing protein [Mycolicibacterium monacense]|uniref:DUF4012 domain-containing protein n=1 Tax=Mycolicibacterium monacense TaxID=85693 RepID=A0AAD1N0V3_MYCMB|nr:DUF4012 domain-containing protein [Mycolicibacterium monacense]MDA4100514.1 membrane protein [Mycolicibacterium monacense DSM 44395]ORB21454.1 hypothetical protein BST34_10240 [Mycolicibacterium monacense DSM 44395]QHP89158.1 DUF4012 domain-containing protein [Mycolicibacterium monacense DSM 44395]BBZ62422.1 hypothetical protein MMON_37230 [Mycolicibacterium monacense]